MLDIVKQALTHIDAQIAIAVAAVYAMNVLLTGLKKALDRVHGKLLALDRADELVTKALGISSMIIGVLTANSAVLPPQAKSEVDAGDVQPPQN